MNLTRTPKLPGEHTRPACGFPRPRGKPRTHDSGPGDFQASARKVAARVVHPATLEARCVPQFRSSGFSAVILAGGRSSRMGRDKAFVEMGGRPLLARQLEMVRSLGTDEVFISGRPNTDYTAFAVPVLLDQFPDAGPLAGIHAALTAANNPLLLVLAVDLPAMDAPVLHRLLQVAPGKGVIPRLGGQVEPLADIYPVSALALLTQLLAQKDFAVRDFAAACVRDNLAVYAGLPDHFARYFINMNHPKPDISR